MCARAQGYIPKAAVHRDCFGAERQTLPTNLRTSLAKVQRRSTARVEVVELLVLLGVAQLRRTVARHGLRSSCRLFLVARHALVVIAIVFLFLFVLLIVLARTFSNTRWRGDSVVGT